LVTNYLFHTIASGWICTISTNQYACSTGPSLIVISQAAGEKDFKMFDKCIAGSVFQLNVENESK